MAQLFVKLLVSVVHTYPETFDTSIKETVIAQPFNHKKKCRHILKFPLVALLYGLKNRSFH